jgi:hypothetical protein
MTEINTSVLKEQVEEMKMRRKRQLHFAEIASTRIPDIEMLLKGMRKELAELPERIESLEKELALCHKQVILGVKARNEDMEFDDRMKEASKLIANIKRLQSQLEKA